jgi:hypothetical protein
MDQNPAIERHGFSRPVPQPVVLTPAEAGGSPTLPLPPPSLIAIHAFQWPDPQPW